MTSRRLLLLTALAALAVPATATATPVASPDGATSVREHQGTIVFSQYDEAAAEWRLAVRRPGAAAELLPVAAGDRPFDADIGTDAAGRQALVFHRCAETCDLFVARVDGSGERAIRGANDPERHDVGPTLSGGRLAWTRIFGEQRNRRTVVYTRTLSAPRSRPSTRLPGVPARRSGRRTTGHAVDALELRGDRLAQVVRYDCPGCSGIAQTELRLVGVRRTTSRLIARRTTGLSGQSFVGPSFAGGRLGWYLTCLGDPSGCGDGVAAAYRYDLSSRRYAKAAGPIRVDGFADAGDRLYEAVGCSEEPGARFNAQCRIEELAAPAYAPTRAPR